MRRLADVEPEIESLNAHADWCAAAEGGDGCTCTHSGLWVACSVCGEIGPCGFDPEGRPLIHSIPPEVDA
jgi:hypothetical protein